MEFRRAGSRTAEQIRGVRDNNGPHGKHVWCSKYPRCCTKYMEMRKPVSASAGATSRVLALAPHRTKLGSTGCSRRCSGHLPLRNCAPMLGPAGRAAQKATNDTPARLGSPSGRPWATRCCSPRLNRNGEIWGSSLISSWEFLHFSIPPPVFPNPPSRCIRSLPQPCLSALCQRGLSLPWRKIFRSPLQEYPNTGTRYRRGG